MLETAPTARSMAVPWFPHTAAWAPHARTQPTACFCKVLSGTTPRGLETVSGHFAEGLKSKKNGCVRGQRALASYQPWDLSYVPRSGSIRF